MNEIGYALGSFCGGLFIGAISWKLGAWLGEMMWTGGTPAATPSAPVKRKKVRAKSR